MTEQPFDALAVVMAHIDPKVIERRGQAASAMHEAAADLQETRHQLKAAELSGTEEDEARGVVRVRRAERRQQEAEQAAKIAEQQYHAAFVAAWRAVRDVEYPAIDAWQVEAEARVLAMRQAAVDLDRELAGQYQRLIAERINPLQAIAKQLRLPASEWMPDHQGKYA